MDPVDPDNKEIKSSPSTHSNLKLITNRYSGNQLEWNGRCRLQKSRQKSKHKSVLTEYGNKKYGGMYSKAYYNIYVVPHIHSHDLS